MTQADVLPAMSTRWHHKHLHTPSSPRAFLLSESCQHGCPKATCSRALRLLTNPIRLHSYPGKMRLQASGETLAERER